MNFLRLAGGILVAVAVGIFVIVRIAFEVIGASTAPEDYAAFKERMPKVFQWLFTTPWPVPTLLLLLAVGLAAWLIFTGTRKTAEAAAAANTPSATGTDEARIKEIVRAEFEAAAERSRENVGGLPVLDYTPPPVDLGPLERRVEDLGQKVSTVSTLAVAMKALVTPLAAQTRLADLEKIEVPELQVPELPSPEVCADRTLYPMSSHAKYYGRIVELIQHLPRHIAQVSGLSEEEIKQKVAEVRKQILADPLPYVHLSEEDRKYWGDSRAKQHWHILKAQLEVLRSYRDQAVRDLSALASRAGARQAEEHLKGLDNV